MGRGFRRVEVSGLQHIADLVGDLIWRRRGIATGGTGRGSAGARALARSMGKYCRLGFPTATS
jgi:hypothetical protein